VDVTVGMSLVCLHCLEEHHEQAIMSPVYSDVEKSEWGFVEYKCRLCGLKVQLNVEVVWTRPAVE